MPEQYLQAHVVDDGFPAGAKEYQARIHALGLPIWALIEEIYAAVLLLLQPAYHKQFMGTNLLTASSRAINVCPALRFMSQLKNQACCHLLGYTWQHNTSSSRMCKECKQEDSRIKQ